MQVMSNGFKALIPQRLEKSVRAKQDVGYYASTGKDTFSRSWEKKKEKLNKHRPGRENNPSTTAPAGNFSPLSIPKRPGYSTRVVVNTGSGVKFTPR